MASVLFSNTASAALASSITTSSTSVTVTTGAGAQFPTISGDNYFYATLTDSSNNLEIVKVTARAADVLTVVRAQEGTTARAYAAADKIELRVTAAALTEYVTLAIAAAKQALYPVGSIYSNATSNVNPNTLLGFGTWTAFGAGRVLVGFDAGNALFDTAEETGGSYDAITVTHNHTATSTFTGSALGTHNHTITDPGHAHKTYSYGGAPQGLVGGGNPFNLLQDTGTSVTGISLGAVSAGTPAGSVSTTVADAGSSGTNKNIQPYITVYMWKRTA